MNPDVKQLWIDALRSGKYRQGNTVLKNEDGHCCALGVLCELAVEAGVTTSVGGLGDIVKYGECGLTQMPPLSVMEWADMPQSNPVVFLYPDSDEIAYISDLNDKHEFPFTTIANYIEEQL